MITVLIVVAVVAIVATGMASAFFMAMNRTGNVLDADQAQEYARGAEEFAMQVLKKSFENEKSVHLRQPWAVRGMAFPIEGGVLTGEIRDLQACLNLNSVLANSEGGSGRSDGKGKGGQQQGQNLGQGQGTVPPDEQDAFGKELSPGAKLFQFLVVELGANTEQREQELREALVDWVDEDQNPAGPGGAEDVYYTGLKTPYRTADQPMASVTELRAVKGFTPKVYDKLHDYVCVLPDANQYALNVNTVAEEHSALLTALYKPGTLSGSQIQNLLKERPPKGYAASELATKFQANQLRVPNSLTTESNYFLLRARAVVGRGEARLEALIKREGGNYRVLSRHFGEENVDE